MENIHLNIFAEGMNDGNKCNHDEIRPIEEKKKKINQQADRPTDDRSTSQPVSQQAT